MSIYDTPLRTTNDAKDPTLSLTTKMIYMIYISNFLSKRGYHPAQNLDMINRHQHVMSGLYKVMRDSGVPICRP